MVFCDSSRKYTKTVIVKDKFLDEMTKTVGAAGEKKN